MPGKRGPWKRRAAIDDFVDRERKHRERPKPWREVLMAETRNPDQLPYGDAWALLIKLAYTYDDAGVPLVDKGLLDSIVGEAGEWDRKYPGVRSETVFEKVKSALWIAYSRREEPELAPVEF